MPIHQVLLELYHHLRNAWRFRWYGALLAWIMFPAALVWIVLMPNVYEARAWVYVDMSSVLRPILSNRIVAPDYQSTINYVRQALLGRENLERVVLENRLAVNAVTERDKNYALNELASSVQVTSRDNTNFNIIYRHLSRETAIAVVDSLLTSFVEDTRGASREGTDTAERFLDERIAEYEGRLQAAEQALADFKKENADSLPGAEGGYFERMRAERDALEAAQKSLRQAESQRIRLLAQIHNEEGSGVEYEPPPNSIDARIRDYRLQLDRLLLDYTEEHPDVKSTREALDRLEKQRTEQLAALGTGSETALMSSNPIYQALRISLNEVEVAIAALQADVETRTAKVAEYQAKIDEVPQVEAELARLNRDYATISEYYQSMVRSRETQELSQKVADTEEVKFQVLDPPRADFRPVAPNRVLLVVAAFFGSLGAGGGLSWLISQLKPIFNNTRTLSEVCELPVLGSVSQALRAQQLIKRRMALLAFASAIGALAVVFGAALYVEVMGNGLHTVVEHI